MTVTHHSSRFLLSPKIPFAVSPKNYSFAAGNGIRIQWISWKLHKVYVFFLLKIFIINLLIERIQIYYFFFNYQVNFITLIRNYHMSLCGKRNNNSE